MGRLEGRNNREDPGVDGKNLKMDFQDVG